jgi:7-carboxy-7-deazaguanine synthase
VPAAAPTSKGHSPRATPSFPVVELFGPTCQGEGPDAGRPAYFVRFGLCDFRCTWCDSLYAVEPGLVRSTAEPATAEDIVTRLGALERGPTLVVLTGGNPAIHELAPVVRALHARGYEVSVETQGSLWRPWLAEVDRLVVSPKAPSSGMADPRRWEQFEAFAEQAREAGTLAHLKVVVFDDVDLAFAARVAERFGDLPFYVSIGTDQNLDEETTVRRMRERFAWVAGAVARRPDLQRAHVLPQLHVLAWGTRRGV